VRAVTRASSRLGCRRTSSAASAPAYPDAPATRTLDTERSPDLLDRGLDRRPTLGDLRVGQGPVRRPEAEPKSEALPTFADLLFSDPAQALSGYDLTAEEASRLRSMSRAQFDQLAKAVPEDRSSFSIIFVD
jgi:hypothetical protein